MVVAGALFGVMGALVKLASEHFSSPELVFYRSAFGLIAIWIVVALRTRHPFAALATPHPVAHLWRGLSGFVALVLFFFAIGRLPLATAVTLNYTAPLFLAGLSAWWLKERHGRGLLFAVLIGFLGVLALLQPGQHDYAAAPALLGLLSGFLAAIAYVNVKQLGSLDEPEWRVVFYFTLIATVGGALWMASAGAHMPDRDEWPLLVALGVSATLAQLAMTRAYHRGRTLVVGALAYTTVGFAALFGVLLFGDRLTPSAWLGMALIVGAGLLALRAGNAPDRI
jgi:drug/metabolite transporter (DMT)-like permease